MSISTTGVGSVVGETTSAGGLHPAKTSAAMIMLKLILIMLPLLSETTVNVQLLMYPVEQSVNNLSMLH